MPSRDLTDAAARFLAGATASACPLDRVVSLLPQLLPGCGAATAARWRDGRAVELAASGRSVAGLLASELERGSGPVIDAVCSGHVWCPDTRGADRWPGFRADALRAGIRSMCTLVQRSGGTVVTVSLYGVKPNSLELDTAALALLFTASGTVRPAAVRGAVHGAGSRDGRPRSPAAPAQDEATVLLMRALHATEQEAGDILRATSRECRADIGDVARRLAAEHARAAAQIRDSAGTALQLQPGARASARQPGVRASARQPGARGAVRAAALGSGASATAYAGPDAWRPREAAEPPRRREARAAVVAPRGPSPRAGHLRDFPLLASLVEQAARLRRQLAGTASSLAQTEARLADTFERSAENLPGHARRLSAMATAAKRYSRHVDQLAQDFSQDHDRAQQQHA